jgi:hypothetical protein
LTDRENKRALRVRNKEPMFFYGRGRLILLPSKLIAEISVGGCENKEME